MTEVTWWGRGGDRSWEPTGRKESIPSAGYDSRLELCGLIQSSLSQAPSVV